MLKLPINKKEAIFVSFPERYSKREKGLAFSYPLYCQNLGLFLQVRCSAEHIVSEEMKQKQLFEGVIKGGGICSSMMLILIN